MQRWVPYGASRPNLKRAVLVAEDGAFWKHEGIDFDQLKESMEINLERMEFARGGSTITQQLAKNLYLSPSKNPIRKVREFLIARRLEAELSKQRILELYLNVIEWGDGIYGAEAAARTYFHKSAAELAPQECGAARRRDREPAAARSGASDAAAQTPAADGHAPHGRGDAAARRCRAGPAAARADSGSRSRPGTAAPTPAPGGASGRAGSASPNEAPRRNGARAGREKPVSRS